MVQLAKNLPTMWETWVQSLGWRIPWRRERQPTPVFWSAEFHGLYTPWGCKESDMTEWLSLNSCEISQRKEDKKPCSRFAKFNQKSPLSFWFAIYYKSYLIPRGTPHFIVLCFIVVFTKRKFVAILSWAKSLLVTFLKEHLLTLCFCVTSW